MKQTTQVKKLDRLIQIYASQRPCKVCGKSKTVGHHLKRRDCDILRFDPKNIMSLCVDCHHEVHKSNINDWDYVSFKDKEYLMDRAWLSLKQMLVNKGITLEEWLKEQELELKELINE